MTILLYRGTTCTLTKGIAKKLDEKLNKSAMSYTEEILEATLHETIAVQLYLFSIFKTIQVRQTRHARHYWRSKDKHISDIL